MKSQERNSCGFFVLNYFFGKGVVMILFRAKLSRRFFIWRNYGFCYVDFWRERF